MSDKEKIKQLEDQNAKLQMILVKLLYDNEELKKEAEELIDKELELL